MKKILLVLVMLVSLSLFGCNNNQQTINAQEDTIKTVENEKIIIAFPYGDREGTYTGEMKEGKPHGIGKFETTNPEGVSWYYEGEFVDGIFNGQGKCVWEDGETRIGEYSNGEWMPTQIEIYDYVGNRLGYTILEPSYDFIQDNEQLFPAQSLDSIAQNVDTTVEYKMITKEPIKYAETIVCLENLTVIQIETTEIPGTTKKFTRANAMDSEFNVYELYYIGELPDIYDGDAINTVYGLPISVGGYENVSGGFTNTISIAVCFVEK